jgi:hypothetical protein
LTQIAPRIGGRLWYRAVRFISSTRRACYPQGPGSTAGRSGAGGPAGPIRTAYVPAASRSVPEPGEWRRINYPVTSPAAAAATHGTTLLTEASRWLRPAIVSAFFVCSFGSFTGSVGTEILIAFLYSSSIIRGNCKRRPSLDFIRSSPTLSQYSRPDSPLKSSLAAFRTSLDVITLRRNWLSQNDNHIWTAVMSRQEDAIHLVT